MIEELSNFRRLRPAVRKTEARAYLGAGLLTGGHVLDVEIVVLLTYVQIITTRCPVFRL